MRTQAHAIHAHAHAAARIIGGAAAAYFVWSVVSVLVRLAA